MIAPNIGGERALIRVWAARLKKLNALGAAGKTPKAIMRAYEATFSPTRTRAEIVAAMASTTAVAVYQHAALLDLDRTELASLIASDPDADLVDEIEQGLATMAMSWILDYSRLAVATRVRTDAVSILVPLPGGANASAAVLLALEAIRKPDWGAGAAASLITHPATLTEMRQAIAIAELAELALFALTPTAEMLEAVDLLTQRAVYSPAQRQARATAANARLSRRTVTATQGSSGAAINRALGIKEYKWVSQRDSRVRSLHVRLNNEGAAGKVLSWSAPDTYGEGHPGEPYGCRCVAVPVIRGTSHFIPGIALRV